MLGEQWPQTCFLVCYSVWWGECHQRLSCFKNNINYPWINLLNIWIKPETLTDDQNKIGITVEASNIIQGCLPHALIKWPKKKKFWAYGKLHTLHVAACQTFIMTQMSWSAASPVWLRWDPRVHQQVTLQHFVRFCKPTRENLPTFPPPPSKVSCPRTKFPVVQQGSTCSSWSNGHQSNH